MEFDRLVIPQSLLDAVVAHARAELPNECVGFLAGRIGGGVGTATQHLPLVNERSSPTAFLTESRSLFTAHKAMRTAATDLLVVYHSHPASAPVPSRRDLAENTYGTTAVWLIVGLAGPEPDVRCWWLEEEGFRPAEWTCATG
jgi:proteasome lid subunit RPN8/RPN11